LVAVDRDVSVDVLDGDVLMFAVYAFSDAVLHSARAFSSGGGGSVIGHLLVGLRPSLSRPAHQPWDSVA
jgi:hypothetical protein